MASTHPRPRAHNRFVPAREVKGSTGELGLVAAILRQALTDARSPTPERQEDIARFVRNGGMAWWGALLGLSDGAIEALEQALAQRVAPRPAPRP
jgi:hypothetical protein